MVSGEGGGQRCVDSSFWVEGTIVLFLGRGGGNAVWILVSG